MSDAVIGIAGTLLGGIVGAWGSYLAQRAQSRRARMSHWDDTRLKLFTDFLSAADQLFMGGQELGTLENWIDSRSEDPKRDKEEMHKRYLNHPARRRLHQAMESLELVASKRTQKAAEPIHKTLLYGAHGGSTTTSADFFRNRDRLLKAMRDELELG